MYFAQGDLARNLRILPAERRLLDMICELFEPCPMALYVPTDCSEFVGNDLVGNEGLAERVALVCVVERFAQTRSRFSVAAYAHDVAFFVEVGHDDAEAFIFLANKVGYRDADIVHLHEACASTFLSRVRYAAMCESRGGGGYDEDGDTSGAGPSSANGSGHVCGPWHASDPLLVAIHDVIFSVFGLGCGSLEVRDIGLHILVSIRLNSNCGYVA